MPKNRRAAGAIRGGRAATGRDRVLAILGSRSPGGDLIADKNTLLDCGTSSRRAVVAARKSGRARVPARREDAIPPDDGPAHNPRTKRPSAFRLFTARSNSQTGLEPASSESDRKLSSECLGEVLARNDLAHGAVNQHFSVLQKKGARETG